MEWKLNTKGGSEMIKTTTILIARKNEEITRSDLESKIRNVSILIPELDRRIRDGEEAKKELESIRKNLKQLSIEYSNL